MALPFFAFFPGDWLADTRVTMGMDLAAEGAYHRLLCLMWEDKSGTCSVRDDDESIAKGLRCSVREWRKIRRILVDGPEPVIAEKNGRLTNKRLTEEWEKAAQMSEARSTAGRAGASGRWGKRMPEPMANAWQTHGKRMPEPMAKPMANAQQTDGKLMPSYISDSGQETERQESPASPDGAEVPPSSIRGQEPAEVDRAAADLLRDLIVENNQTAKVTPAQLRSWANSARLMRCRDGRAAEDIEAHIRWTQSDPFWAANVLSMDAVRRGWDRHTLQMQRPARASPVRAPQYRPLASTGFYEPEEVMASAGHADADGPRR